MINESKRKSKILTDATKKQRVEEMSKKKFEIQRGQSKTKPKQTNASEESKKEKTQK